MGAASGYFILLCALSLGVEVYGFGTTYPAMNVRPRAADALMDQSHEKDDGANPASEPSHTTIAHLVKATTQPETHAVLTLPAHPLTSKSTDDITTPAPKHKTTAKQQVLTQRKEPETESELRATTTLLTLPAHPLTSKSTDDITTPAPKHKTTAKQQVLTQRKEPETESELRATTTFTDELSKPKIYYQDVHYKTLEISCFSEHGRLPITYSIIKNKTEVLKSLTVHSREPADFTIEMKPGKSAEHVCKAESGGQSKFSEPLLEIKIPEEEETPTHSDADKEEDLSEPKHLITLSHILTSVDRSVQHRNTILMSVCGPVILLVLGMFIIVVHFHQRRDNCDKL